MFNAISIRLIFIRRLDAMSISLIPIDVVKDSNGDNGSDSLSQMCDIHLVGILLGFSTANRNHLWILCFHRVFLSIKHLICHRTGKNKFRPIKVAKHLIQKWKAKCVKVLTSGVWFFSNIDARAHHCVRLLLIKFGDFFTYLSLNGEVTGT